MSIKGHYFFCILYLCACFYYFYNTNRFLKVLLLFLKKQKHLFCQHCCVYSLIWNDFNYKSKGFKHTLKTKIAKTYVAVLNNLLPLD